ncbi:hypothetical protein [Segetibacter koreensis]|uniref:hypothetical protein n=1 Tax=Segetibacter koreensis TaxID=398037 RepID=UPI000379848B|nr:hypothetical protein [Segetibacter koreensis]
MIKEYFIKKVGLYDVEFFRDYINIKDTWYDVAVKVEGKDIKCRMHKNKDQAWRIVGNRLPYVLLKLEEEFSEAIGKNEH